MMRIHVAVLCPLLVAEAALWRNPALQGDLHAPGDVDSATDEGGAQKAEGPLDLRIWRVRGKAAEDERRDGIAEVRRLITGVGANQSLSRAVAREALRSVRIGLIPELFGTPLANASSLPSPSQCAMVSSSPVLLEARPGAAVDAVDGPVMRFNSPVVSGFEDNVGSRTDMLVVNSMPTCSWAKKSKPPPGVKYVVFSSTGDQKDAACFQGVVAKFPEINFYALDSKPMEQALHLLIDKIQDAPGRKAPVFTAGMLGFVFLLNLCKEVHHWGFAELMQNGTANSCNGHYWTTHVSGCAWHNMAREHALLWILSDAGRSPGEGVVAGMPRLQYAD